MAERGRRPSFTDLGGNVYRQAPNRRWVSPTSDISYSRRQGERLRGTPLPRGGLFVRAGSTPDARQHIQLGSGRNQFRQIRPIRAALAQLPDGSNVWVGAKAVWPPEHYRPPAGAAPGERFVRYGLMEDAGFDEGETERALAREEQAASRGRRPAACSAKDCGYDRQVFDIDTLRAMARDSDTAADFVSQVFEAYPRGVFAVDFLVMAPQGGGR